MIHSIRDNLCYASMSRTAKGWLENKRMRAEIADEQVNGLQIKVPSVKASAGSLSGGNQQKVVVGNWLNTQPKIMLYDEPSRGIDVAAKQQIFEIMWEQSKQGISTIFVSSELEELLETCNRILIMSDGKITGEAVPEELSVEALYSMCMED
ncbi:Arabinose import ATP-binding protein AraG [bioreactor metagenome]|uniref:Arabinose import ATP-binding protein AraG n=1 Tax=bioreactor metagenome TaxID=1076179 RepID=A0A645FCV1_9ZZZZ